MVETANTKTDPPVDVERPQVPQGRLESLFDEATLASRIQAMAEDINRTYAGVERITVVCLLKGGFMFLSDLIRHIEIPIHIEFVRLSSYGNSTKSSGTVQPVNLSLPKLEGEHVLVVEDIIDTGLTLSFFRDYLQSLHNAASIRVAVLLDKPEARLPETKTVVDFVGFSVGNQFLVGYGLDYRGYYRNLPYVGILHLDESPEG